MKLKIKTSWWVYAGIIVFIILNSVGILKEFYLFNIIPFFLLLVAIAFLSLDALILIIVFFVPLSVPLSEIVQGLPIDMNLPTEPFLAGVLLIFVLKLLHERSFDKKILTHPVSVSIYLYLIWILVTTLSSTMPIVSLKIFLSRVWFIIAFYFLTTQLFKNKNNTTKYILLYSISLSIVVLYATFRIVKYGIFEEKIAYWASNPFYKDHTIYGAMLAFYIPPLAAFVYYKKFSNPKRLLYLGILFILTIGLISSYSRAAWISIIVAFSIWAIIQLKIKFWVIATSFITFVIFIFLFGNTIMRTLESNDQDSSGNNISEQIQSITNISTDASNVERLNRWKCAIRMFKQKPILGWGPGTYMFQYAPFQRSYEKTIISTNKGDGGNAHSEYLGPLCEQGILGPFFYLLIIISTIITASKVIRKTSDDFSRMMSISAILGLVTYYLHGILNNFLNTDKAAAPFWGFIAIIVAIDIYHKKKEQPTAE
ncbi:MAG: O-antigen ligase family protein [Salinivirgaceae bacterium]|nr:O-antigen ligase family protein [Salinivirgaceae bacterium]